MNATRIVAFVLGSGARRDVLDRLSEGPATGRQLVEAAEASESAVYDAVNRLEERGLLAETDENEWALTGSGRLVADAIRYCGRVESIIATDERYWRSHDVGALPERFRRDVDRLDDPSIVRSPEADPYRAARRVEDAIEGAEEFLWIVAPIYDDRRAEALLTSEAPDRRLIMTPAMVERLLRDEPEGPDEDVGDLEIRVCEAGTAMVVTESELLLSLPECDGGYDATTEVVAESENAIAWGRRLFEHYWTDAPGVEEYVATELPELASRME